MEQGDIRRKQAVSEEQDCWQMGQEQQLCSQKTHISTGLGLPMGKHHRSRFRARGKATVCDKRCQGTVPLDKEMHKGCERAEQNSWHVLASILDVEAHAQHRDDRGSLSLGSQSSTGLKSLCFIYKHLGFLVLITHHFVQQSQEAAPQVLWESKAKGCCWIY